MIFDLIGSIYHTSIIALPSFINEETRLSSPTAKARRMYKTQPSHAQSPETVHTANKIWNVQAKLSFNLSAH